ncbi:hypothetical protein [Aquifex aeolicus]|uniref:hypothetical protein n=1 Tax=Aquifex aeolicus TaxID=63363 RepID=UPI0013E89A31|nr:hypothetical protein [Aquifex aeolicus]
MKVIVFDIETVPDKRNITYDDYLYIQKRGKREKTQEDIEREFSFNPFTLILVSFSTVLIEDSDNKRRKSSISFRSNKPERQKN